MTKIVIQISHVRLGDDPKQLHSRGDVVDLSDETIKMLGTSVKRLDEVNKTGDGVQEAMQRKDSEIKALKAAIEEMKLDVIALKDAAATPVKEETQASKTTRKTPTGAKSDKASV